MRLGRVAEISLYDFEMYAQVTATVILTSQLVVIDTLPYPVAASARFCQRKMGLAACVCQHPLSCRPYLWQLLFDDIKSSPMICAANRWSRWGSSC